MARRTMEQSRNLASQLTPGRRTELTNKDLRHWYGYRRITSGRRTEIADELRRCGVEILSDPARAPLVVRNAARSGDDAGRTTSRARTGWLIAAAVALFFLIVGVVASGGGDDKKAPVRAQASGASAATAASEPAATVTDDGQTRAAAILLVREDEYDDALEIADNLSDDDRSYVRRRIANRLAGRARYALRQGDRQRAAYLLSRADEFPNTAKVSTVTGELSLAKQRASARRAARRERARQRRLQKEQEQQALEQKYAAPDTSTNGPICVSGSTVNYCGKRDGDGDGCYCEGD